MQKRTLATTDAQPVSHNPKIEKRVLLERGEISNLTNFSQAVFTPGQTAPGHSHPDMTEVFFVRSGSGTIRVDGVEHGIEADDCVVVEPGEEHEIANTGDDDLVLLYYGLVTRPESPGQAR